MWCDDAWLKTWCSAWWSSILRESMYNNTVNNAGNDWQIQDIEQPGLLSPWPTHIEIKIGYNQQDKGETKDRLEPEQWKEDQVRVVCETLRYPSINK